MTFNIRYIILLSDHTQHITPAFYKVICFQHVICIFCKSLMIFLIFRLRTRCYKTWSRRAYRSWSFRSCYWSQLSSLPKYMLLPLESRPIVITLKVIKKEVIIPINIQKRSPSKAPRPRIPAVIPTKMLLMTFIFSSDALLRPSLAPWLMSRYFSFNC